MRACGVNFADTMARVGLYPDAPKLPAVVGYEVAGTRADTGERVLAGTRFGGYASRVVVAEDDIVPLPERLSFEQGAAIPVNYATAWAGLVRYGGLQAGERVLLQAAAGGVGIAATQIAKQLRRRGLRHRLARQARRDPRPGRRRRARLPQARLAARAAEVRPRHGRDRRPLVPHAPTTCSTPAGG